MDRNSRLVAVAIAVVTLFRLFYAAGTGLAYDEAYYWCWSRHLDFWYYDQGPWIAWSIRATTSLLGSTELGVRLGAILYAAGGTGFLFAAVRRLAGSTVAAWTVLLLLLAPLPAAGGVLSTYDGPQVFFWCAALWTLTRALDGSAAWWYATGALCLAGILSKVTMVFFPLGAFLLLMWHPPYRRWLLTVHPYLAGLIAALAFVTLFGWDRSHDHLYSLHTATLGRRHTDAAPGRWIGDFLGGQLGALGPALFVAEIVALVRLARPDRRPFGLDERACRTLLCFAAPMLLVCVATSLRSKLEINWPVSAHMAGIVPVAAWWGQMWSRGRRVAVALMLAPCLLLQTVALFPSILPSVGVTLPASVGVKLNETYGWPIVSRTIDTERSRLASDAGPAFVAGTNYKVCSIVSFTVRGQDEAACLFLGTRRNQFLLWNRRENLEGRNAVLCFDDDPGPQLDLARQLFEKVSEPRRVDVFRNGFSGPVKRWWIVPCHGYRGADPAAFAQGF